MQHKQIGRSDISAFAHVPHDPIRNPGPAQTGEYPGALPEPPTAPGHIVPTLLAPEEPPSRQYQRALFSPVIKFGNYPDKKHPAQRVPFFTYTTMNLEQ